MKRQYVLGGHFKSLNFSMLLGTCHTLRDIQAFTGCVLLPLPPKQTRGFLEEGKAVHCSHCMLLLATKQEMDGVISVAIGAFHHWPLEIMKKTQKKLVHFVFLSWQPEERSTFYVINLFFFFFLNRWKYWEIWEYWRKYCLVSFKNGSSLWI